MVSKWLAKRRLKKYLSGCNFGMVRTLLVKKFSGGVIPNDLIKLLDAFCSKPEIDTAMDLILYDPKFIAFFELARSGGVTEHLFKKGLIKKDIKNS